jgi:ribosomal protein L29
MAKLKSKDIKLMNEKEKAKKVLELKADLIKARANAGKSNLREIKKTIARILTVKA